MSEEIEVKPIAQSDPAAAFQKLLEKNNNDGVKLASQLFDENFHLRVKNRDLELKLPKDGTVSLTADEHKLFESYKALGIEPDAIKTSLESIPELEKTAKELAQMETFREVAAIGNYKVPVLKKLMAEYPDAAFEIKAQKDKDGKEAKVAFIRNGDKELPFTEFADANFADFLPALKAEAVTPAIIKNGTVPDPTPANGSAPTANDNAAMAAQARSTRNMF